MNRELMEQPGAYANRVAEGIPLGSLDGWYMPPFVDPHMGKNGSKVVVLTNPEHIDAVYEVADHTRSLDPTFNGSLLATGLMRFIGLLDPVTITDDSTSADTHSRARRELARGFNRRHMKEVVARAAHEHLLDELQASDPEDVIDLRAPLKSYVATAVAGVVGLSARAAYTLPRNAEAFGEMTWDIKKHPGGIARLGHTALQCVSATMRHKTRPNGMIAAMIERGVRPDRAITHSLAAVSGGMATSDTLTNLLELVHYHDQEKTETWQALSHPEQSGRIVERLLPDASSLVAWVVRAGTDLSLDNAEFSKGQTFLTVTGSGNQDKSRDWSEKQPFGQGPHACIGSHLGRLIITVGAETLAANFPHMTRGSDTIPTGRANAAFRWPTTLPIKLGSKA